MTSDKVSDRDVVVSMVDSNLKIGENIGRLFKCNKVLCCKQNVSICCDSWAHVQSIYT